MLKMHEIRELIKLVDESNLTAFDYEKEGCKLSIKKDNQTLVQAPQNVSQVAVPQASASIPAQEPIASPASELNPGQTMDQNQEKKDGPVLHSVKSPMVGTFYAAPTPDTDPYVKVGDKITETSVVCIVEAMKLMNEIEAEIKGEIVEILVENGQLVEYGQPLFLIKPE